MSAYLFHLMRPLSFKGLPPLLSCPVGPTVGGRQVSKDTVQRWGHGLPGHKNCTWISLFQTSPSQNIGYFLTFPESGFLRIVIVPVAPQLLWELNEIMAVKILAQHAACSKSSRSSLNSCWNGILEFCPYFLLFHPKAEKKKIPFFVK